MTAPPRPADDGRPDEPGGYEPPQLLVLGRLVELTQQFPSPPPPPGQPEGYPPWPPR